MREGAAESLALALRVVESVETGLAIERFASAEGGRW